MNKFIITLAALASLSTAALAERSYDLRDSPEARGTFTLNYSGGNVDKNVQLLSIGQPSVEQMDIRRLDEKNGTKG